jgi:hypothetical protein
MLGESPNVWMAMTAPGMRFLCGTSSRRKIHHLTTLTEKPDSRNQHAEQGNILPSRVMREGQRSDKYEHRDTRQARGTIPSALGLRHQKLSHLRNPKYIHIRRPRVRFVRHHK